MNAQTAELHAWLSPRELQKAEEFQTHLTYLKSSSWFKEALNDLTSIDIAGKTALEFYSLSFLESLLEIPNDWIVLIDNMINEHTSWICLFNDSCYGYSMEEFIISPKQALISIAAYASSDTVKLSRSNLKVKKSAENITKQRDNIKTLAQNTVDLSLNTGNFTKSTFAYKSTEKVRINK